MSKIKLLKVSEIIPILARTYKNITKKKPIYGYDGPLLNTTEILRCSPNIDEQFSEEGIKYNLEKGRTKLDVLIMCAFQLGIEQGINMCTKDITLLELQKNDWTEEEWKAFELKFQVLLWTKSPRHKAEYEAKMKEIGNIKKM